MTRTPALPVITSSVLTIILMAGWLSTSRAGEPIKDTEAATHATDAAWYQVKDTYRFPGFKVIQLELGVLSHYSYLLISGAEAMVVDPGRDVDVYREIAKKEGAAIVAVYLTHSHADFVDGHVELADVAPIYISAKTGAKYDHKPVKEGSTLAVGDALVTFLDTPGHTPDGTCAVVASKQKPGQPLLVFTGDTLFIGSVGRPDLLGEGMAASTLAAMMFDTWNEKLARLPDDARIFPACCRPSSAGASRSAWNGGRRLVCGPGCCWHWRAASSWALPAGWPMAARRARPSVAAPCCSAAAWPS
jgi:glyoxylase-like metal-dependent hydrolase (beta-lactamase superfamily II)